MRTRNYGQFCGLARAAEVLGQRWTILIVRDLLVGPRRYSDLLAGLPGIPTNVLASRLKELEEDGLVVREARTGSDRSVVYQATARAEELQASARRPGPLGCGRDAGATGEGEVVTDASLVGSLRVAGQGGTPPRRRPVTYEVRVGSAVAHATVARGEISVAPGPDPAPDLVVNAGPGFRDVLAGLLDPDAALAAGPTTSNSCGDGSLFADFGPVQPFPTAPLSRPDIVARPTLPTTRPRPSPSARPRAG